jgi:Fe-S cluster assembly iron-binding protein IscA
MKKLTSVQQAEQNEQEKKFLAENVTLLFDVEGSIALGKKYKLELEEHTNKNKLVIQEQKEKCLADFAKLQTFLGVHKDFVFLAEMVQGENDQCFNIIIGGGLTSHSITLSYYFGRDYWAENENHTKINGKNHQDFYAENVEVWCDKVGETEDFTSIEKIFEDNDYITQIEKLLIEHVIKY